LAYFCYLLECSDGTFYTGWTTDPVRRAAVHNAGRGARYTKTRRPVQLVYVEELSSRSEAMAREIAIKNMTRARKMNLISKSNNQLL
jgi:putative endonuclease